MRRASVAALVLAWGCIAANAQAQTDEDQKEAAGRRQNDEGAALLSAGSPPDRAMAGFFEPTFTVTTEDGETKASAALSFDLTRDEGPEPGETFNTVGRTKFSIVATSPAAGKSDKTLSQLFTGDSLIRDSKVKLALSHLWNKLGTGEGGQAYVDEAQRTCVDVEAGKWIAANAGTALPLARYMAALDQELTVTERNYTIALDLLARGTFEPKFYANLVATCVPATGRKFSSSGELVDAYHPRPDEYRNRFIDKTALGWFVGVDGSAGQDGYTYLDRTTLSTPEVNRTSWEIGAYGGLLNWDATFSARARAVYGRTWKLPDEATACGPVGDPPTNTCETGPDGPPEPFETLLVSVETRHLLTLDSQRSVALAPQVTWRQEDDVFGIEVPVYLAPDKDGQLSGGFKFAWTSKDDEFGVGIFVGMPLGALIPN